MPKISVIVPIYNAKNHLKRCIDSILSQDFKDFELLLIDDGSTDGSDNLCNSYAKNDHRIQVFHKPNEGVSSARNMGLSYARGEWICFIDSDDSLVDGAFSCNWNLFTEELVLFPYITHKEEVSQIHLLEAPEIINNYSSLLKNNEYSIRVIWSKLYKRTSIGDLRFDQTLTFGEDTLFNLTYLSLIKTIRKETKLFYNYTISDGTYWIKYHHKIEDSIHALSKIFNAYKQLKVKENIFMKNIFFSFKRICQEEIYETPSLWFKNNIVNEIYHTIKHGIGLKQRFLYKLTSYTFISKINVLLRK